MGLRDDIQEDITQILDVEEFAIDAIFDSNHPIKVIEIRESEVVDVGAEYSTVKPHTFAKTTDVPSASGKTLEIGDITFNITNVSFDVPGLTTLFLSLH